MANILIIEDEREMRDGLKLNLEYEGHRVAAEGDGDSGLATALEGGIDLIVLDVMLPGRSGIEVLKELREKGYTTPVVMLTARGLESDKVQGLKLGADDYVTKPFSLRELKSRIRALLRRRSLDGGVPEDEYRDPRLVVRRGAMDCTLDGDPVRLTVREFELLWYLVTNRPRVASRERILERVWGISSDVETRTVDVHVRALRAKLGAEIIETVIGAGYRFRGYV